VASSVPSVRVIKRFPFKGGTKVWSNRYYFTGGTPSSGANWDALMDAITNIEKAMHKDSVIIQEAVAYEAGTDIPVRSKSYTLLGTCAAAGNYTPGECVALARFSTAARSSKNHPVYCFSYWHGVLSSATAGQQDLVASAHKTAYGV